MKKNRINGSGYDFLPTVEFTTKPTDKKLCNHKVNILAQASMTLMPAIIHKTVSTHFGS